MVLKELLLQGSNPKLDEALQNIAKHGDTLKLTTELEVNVEYSLSSFIANKLLRITQTQNETAYNNICANRKWVCNLAKYVAYY